MSEKTAPEVRAELMSLAGVKIDQAAPKRDPDVWARLDRYPDKFDNKTGAMVAEGSPKRTRANLVTILDGDPALAVLEPRYNEFTGIEEIRGQRLSDVTEEALAIWLSQVYDLDPNLGTLHGCLIAQARRRSYHPVREYLDELAWDGVKRSAGWLSTFLGAADTPLNAAIGEAWFTSAVARIMRPGCKVDTVLILVGPQGARKSSAFRVLASSPWFSDTAVDLHSKDAFTALQGCWLLEWAELDSLRRRDASTAKSFITSSVDRYRPAYGRNVVEWKRQCVIVGSTNEAVPLNDSSGSRRFWPILVGQIDLDGLERERDQLWAEAVARYRSGAPWWLDAKTEQDRASAAQQFEASDPWEEKVSAFLEGRREVSIPDVLESALELDPGKWNRTAEMRLAAILAGIGWTKGPRRRVAGRRIVPWHPPGHLL